MVTYIDAFEAPARQTGQIKLHDKAAFEGMHVAGNLTAQCLDKVGALVKPGVSTQELDDFIYQFAVDHKATPATLNYRGFTHSSCISLNHVICHGIPSSKKLKENDILNIDVTLVVDGWHGDSSRMYVAGNAKRAAQRLIDVTHESLMRAIAVSKPGYTTGDIGHAIQSYVEAERCTVVRDFCGHGLGQLFHDEPNILHYGRPGQGPELRPGMIFTIEPMINIGKPAVRMLSDGWTAVTRDKSLTAQFEHSIGITEDEPEIFTLSPRNIFKTKFE